MRDRLTSVAAFMHQPSPHQCPLCSSKHVRILHWDSRTGTLAGVSHNRVQYCICAEQESAQVCLPPDFAFALGLSGDVLGQVLTDGRVIDSHGNCKAMMQSDGTVKTSEGLLVGAAARGMAIMDPEGKLVAVLNEQGFVKTIKGKSIDGDIDMDDTGLLTTAKGDAVGSRRRRRSTSERCHQVRAPGTVTALLCL